MDTKDARKARRSSLISMETEQEWKHVIGMTKNNSQRRWFIGLRIVSESREWCWLSDNTSCINNSALRWSSREPNNFNTEECVEMLKNGEYNNVGCEKDKYDDDPGYICENSESE